MTFSPAIGRLASGTFLLVMLMIIGGRQPAAAQMLTAWGYNGRGQTTVPALSARVVGVSAGDSHSLALLEDGTVVAWGYNSSGQINVPAGLSGVTAIAAGETHSLALRSDGTVVVWGYYSSITQPAGLAGVVAIAAGGTSLALRANSTVFEWDSTGQSTGRVPATLSGVTAIATGDYHSMALKSDGTVVAWSSYNYAGQATVPPALPPAKAIAAGSAHSLVLLRDGTVAAWGENLSGQSTVSAGLQDIVAIAAGGAYSLALKADGTLVGWGGNANGQTTTPVGTGRILTLSAGGAHNLALTESSSGEPPVILSSPTALTNAAGTAGSGLLFHHRIVATGSPLAYAATGLPAGLTLDPAAGIISGVTGQPGEFAVTLSAQNAAGTGTQLLRLRVQGVPHFVSPPVVLPLTVPQNLQNLAANLPNQWTATGLPPGLTIHPVTGAITGSPSHPGVYDVHFVFSNAFGQAEADWQVEVTSVIMLGTNAVPLGGLGRVTGMSDYAGTRMFLRADGTVTSDSWRLQNYMPDGLTGVSGVAAGPAWGLALRSGGTVVAWPNSKSSYYGIDAPTDQSGVVAIAAGHGWKQGSSPSNFGFALKNDGTVAAFGTFWAAYDLNLLLQAVSGVVAVSAYERTFHAVKSDGTVFSIGDYSAPPLPGRFVNRPAGLNEVVAVSTNWHTLALKRNGTVVAWGNNSSGQCNVPAGLADVIAVAAGERFSLALKQDGTVLSWGASLGGAVPVTALHGVAAIAAGSTAMALCGLTPGESPFIISPTAAITTATTDSGGSIQFHYRIMATGTPTQFTASGLPQGLTLNAATGLITGKVAQPGDYDVVLGATGEVGTGNRPLRIHVLGMPKYMSGLPAMLPSVSPSIQLYASNGPNTWTATGLPPGLTLNNTTGMITGTVQDPGLYPVSVTIRNAFGFVQVSEIVEVPPVLRLGNSPYAEVPSGVQRITAAAVSDSVLLLDESGTVHTRSSYGLPANLNDIVALGPYGSYHDMALRGSGEVLAWGSATYPANIYGENTVPRDVTTAVAVAAGTVHSLALLPNGTVAAWGWSEYGRTAVPASLGDVVAIAAGDSHSLALRSDGTVAAWGANGYGQSTVPNGLANVAAIAAGQSHSLALKRDGKVVVWGGNDNGQRNVPAGLSGVVAISCGWNHCAALKSDGRVVVWGHDYYGQTAVPSSLTNIAAISAGQWQTMLIMGRPAGARPVIVSPKRAVTSTAGTAGPGLQFSYRIAATGIPVSFSASGLPGGLTLNPSTGVISGLPEEAGEYEITVRATNAGGTGSALVQLYVLGVPQLLESEIQINAATPVQRQIHASAVPILWSASGLPEGLTLEVSTGVLSGMITDPGIHRIPLSIANTRYTGTAELRLLVMPARDAAQAAYAAWRDTFWMPEATNADPASDGDGDGRSNLLEFALGTDPRSADRGAYLQFFHNTGAKLEMQVSVTEEAAAALLIRAQFSGAPDFGADRMETMAAEPAFPEPSGKVRLRFVQPDASPDEQLRQFGRIVFSLPQ